MFLKSSDSKATYYKDNTPYHFRVKLNQRLAFDGFWVVSLTELKLDKVDLNHVNDHYVDVFCNICHSSLVGDKQIPLLRRIDLREGPQYTFANEYNMRVMVKETPDIELCIRASDGTPLSFLEKETHATLHFRQYPFLN